jgi:hypothetical protein
MSDPGANAPTPETELPAGRQGNGSQNDAGKRMCAKQEPDLAPDRAGIRSGCEGMQDAKATIHSAAVTAKFRGNGSQNGPGNSRCQETDPDLALDKEGRRCSSNAVWRVLRLMTSSLLKQDNDSPGQQPSSTLSGYAQANGQSMSACSAETSLHEGAEDTKDMAGGAAASAETATAAGAAAASAGGQVRQREASASLLKDAVLLPHVVHVSPDSRKARYL